MLKPLGDGSFQVNIGVPSDVKIHVIDGEDIGRWVRITSTLAALLPLFVKRRISYTRCNSLELVFQSIGHPYTEKPITIWWKDHSCGR